MSELLVNATMPKLTIEERIEIIALSREGVNNSELSRRYNVQRRTIINVLQKAAEGHTVEDRTRTGRPRAMTARDDRALARLSLRQPTAVSRSLSQDFQLETGLSIAPRTVRRRLRSMDITCRVAKRRPILSRQHRQRRLQWAREHQNLTAEDWNNVIFSDEVPLHMVQNRQRRYVRSRGRVQQHHRPTAQAGGASILCWGAFSSHGVLPLVDIRDTLNAERYVQTLEDNLLLTLRALNNDDIIFQQDNARPHVARRTMNWFQEQGVHVMDWPPQSPDLNPIENLWSMLKSRLDRRESLNIPQLLDNARAEWNSFTAEDLQNLLNSMPRRINEVIAHRGGHTHY